MFVILPVLRQSFNTRHNRQILMRARAAPPALVRVHDLPTQWVAALLARAHPDSHLSWRTGTADPQVRDTLDTRGPGYP